MEGVPARTGEAWGSGEILKSETNRRLLGCGADLGKVVYYRAHAKVASAVRAMRDQFGLTQRELGDRAGLTQAQVSRYEDPDYEGHKVGMLSKLAAAVGWEFQPHFGPPGEFERVGIGIHANHTMIRAKLNLVTDPEQGTTVGSLQVEKEETSTQWLADIDFAGATR